MAFLPSCAWAINAEHARARARTNRDGVMGKSSSIKVKAQPLKAGLLLLRKESVFTGGCRLRTSEQEAEAGSKLLLLVGDLGE